MQEPDLCRSRRAASAALIQCRRVQGRSYHHHPCSTLLDGLIRGVLFSERVTILITSYDKTEHDHNGDAAANYSAAPRSSTRWPRGGRASPQGYRTLVCGLCAFFLPVLRQAGAAAWRIRRDNRMSVRITATWAARDRALAWAGRCSYRERLPRLAAVEKRRIPGCLVGAAHFSEAHRPTEECNPRRFPLFGA